MTPRRDGVIVLLGALTFLAPLSIDISLPGLPAVARALAAPPAEMQWTLSAFILMFGVGQLVLGPASDRYGRRPVLLAALAIFALAAVACAEAGGVRTLIALRLLQGFTACAGTVCAFATVQDLWPGRTASAPRQAVLSGINNLAPIVAPLIGAALLLTFGWRSLYGVLAVAGALLFVAVLLWLPETASRTASGLGARYRRVLALPRTARLAALVFTMFGGYFAMISGSPFVLVTQMRLGPAEFAAAFAINAVTALAGSVGAGVASVRWGPERVLAGGVGIVLAAGLANALAGAFAAGPLSFVATMSLYALGFGAAIPGAYAAALAHSGADSGVASGILGAALAIGGACGSALAGALGLEPSLGVGLTAAGSAALAAGFYAASRERAEPADPAPG